MHATVLERVMHSSGAPMPKHNSCCSRLRYEQVMPCSRPCPCGCSRSCVAHHCRCTACRPGPGWMLTFAIGTLRPRHASRLAQGGLTKRLRNPERICSAMSAGMPATPSPMPASLKKASRRAASAASKAPLFDGDSTAIVQIVWLQRRSGAVEWWRLLLSSNGAVWNWSKFDQWVRGLRAAGTFVQRQVCHHGG